MVGYSCTTTIRTKSPIAMAVAVVELEGDDLTATLDDHGMAFEHLR